MAQNQAAWLTGASQPFVVKGIANHKPGPGEVIIKNAAVAIVFIPFPEHVRNQSNLSVESRRLEDPVCSIALEIYIDPNS